MRDPTDTALQKEKAKPARLPAVWKKAIIRSLAVLFLVVVMFSCLWTHQPHEGICAALFAVIAAFFAEDYVDSRVAGYLVGVILDLLAALLWLVLLLT